ncbi:hypothetical protein NPIL_456641 [Nephila pilipes]|uniref:Uncharacterized protein n=1 Tax=Nephila pilipes TaxID=299642 RepID=A0A8X6PEH7_NEPPI|nr:hypothetical protein NPIL_456641 [Nephila pilipes]
MGFATNPPQQQAEYERTKLAQPYDRELGDDMPLRNGLHEYREVRINLKWRNRAPSIQGSVRLLAEIAASPERTQEALEILPESGRDSRLEKSTILRLSI